MPRKEERRTGELGSFAKTLVVFGSRPVVRCTTYCASGPSRSHTQTITTKDDDEGREIDARSTGDRREIDGETWCVCPPSGKDSTL